MQAKKKRSAQKSINMWVPFHKKNSHFQTTKRSRGYKVTSKTDKFPAPKQILFTMPTQPSRVPSHPPISKRSQTERMMQIQTNWKSHAGKEKEYNTSIEQTGKRAKKTKKRLMSKCINRSTVLPPNKNRSGNRLWR